MTLCVRWYCNILLLQPSGPGRYVFGHLDCQHNGDYVLEEKKREEDEPQDDEEPVMIPRWRGGAISVNT